MLDYLKDAGVAAGKDAHYPWFIIYNFEAMQPRVNSQQTSRLVFETCHIPISVSVCSNGRGFTDPICFFNSDPSELIYQMLAYMDKIQAAAYSLAKEKPWKRLLDMLNDETIIVRKKKVQEELT